MRVVYQRRRKEGRWGDTRPGISLEAVSILLMHRLWNAVPAAWIAALVLLRLGWRTGPWR